jgi:serine/threonine-protein kinase
VGVPSQIGRYRVLDVLGQGAMGVVYRGVDASLDRQVAIKVMSAGAMADAESRARFKREGQAAARLQHPNIVTIYELGEHEGSPFMALELLDGVDLQHAIESGLRPNPKATLPVVLQLLAGLGHAHDNGIVHRDVKPSNVFLPRGRAAKIMDFGVARLGQAMTTTGLVVGTPNYMSPEQVRAGHLDGRSDLFSAGLILYELVTGEKAYRGDSIVSLLYKIAHEDPDLNLLPRGPQWEPLRRVLERSLAKDPDQRYASAAAMSADLAQAFLELGGTADWATASDLGLMVKAPARVPAVSLGATAPPLAAPMALGTDVRPEEARPESVTSITPPAVPVWKSPMGLAAVLGVGAAVLLVATIFQLTRGPKPIPSSAAASPLAAPSSSVPSIAPRTPRASPTTAPTPVPPPSSGPARPVASPKPSTVAPQPTPAAIEATPPEPPAATARVDRANEHLDNRRYGQALAEARAVLKREPENAEARMIAEEAEAAMLVEGALRKAKDALQKGDKDGAVEELKRGLAVNASDARLLALWREATQ